MFEFKNILFFISLLLLASSAETDFLLVITLDGKFTLVDKFTGAVRWTYNSGLVNDCTYSGDVIIIPEIHCGRLYEYPGDHSEDLLYRINSSIFEMVARSPELINSLYTTGYKSDHWLQLDLDTGELLKSAHCFSAYQCYTSKIDSHVPKRRILDLGMSEYHFMLWDLNTSTAKVNVTYQSLPSHMSPDLQDSNLTHVATLEPSIVTFDGFKFLWHLPLSSPVVDLFSVEVPPSSSDPPPPSGENGQPIWRKQAVPPQTNRFLPVTLHQDGQCAEQSYRLRRIVFTTYTLDLNQSYSLPHYPTQSVLWEEKLSRTNQFVPSLYLGEADSPPLYVIHTLAEAKLKPRRLHRVAKHLLLAYENSQQPDGPGSVMVPVGEERVVFWPKSLIGLYLLHPDSPRVNPVWSPPPSSPHLFQLTDQSHSSGRPLLPMYVSDISTPGFSRDLQTILWTFSTAILLTFSVALILVWWFRGRLRPYLHYQTPWDHASSVLHPSFDCANNEGWAGHPVDISHHLCDGSTDPEVVRFNVRRILGFGANGTVVFEGTYGGQPVAVKRILRRLELEKSWLREHRILMHHHHEHLIRCFWTGSSPNFHYLVLQRCVTSLLEAIDTDVDSSSPLPKRPLSRFGLSPLECVHQLLAAIVFLHSKSIVHRDIKPSNIFILEATSPSPHAPSSRLVLGDFGLSLPLENGLFTNSICVDLATTTAAAGEDRDGGVAGMGRSDTFTYGTLGWMAPEMCAPSKDNLTQSVDVFAFGLVAHFILTLGGHPFLPPAEAPSPLATETTPVKPRRHLRDVYCSLASLQSMQKAINEFKLPRLHDLDDCITTPAGGADEAKVDRMRSCLAQQLVGEALDFDPSDRCSIEVLAGSPLFWSAEDIMAFYTEVSNFMDEWKPIKFATASGSASFFPPLDRPRPGLGGDGAASASASVDIFQDARQHLSALLDDHWARVFSGSWLRHLDSVLVDDLRSVRSYQDKSLTQLLRAIRNKRNHIWSLPPTVRKVLGSSDTAMAEHWNSRFPSLLPLTYCLARVHLAQVDHFRRFLPGRLAAGAAEHFVNEYCHPSMPAMWTRLATSVSTAEHSPLTKVDAKLSPRMQIPLNPAPSSPKSAVNRAETYSLKGVGESPSARAKALAWSKVAVPTSPWLLPSKPVVFGHENNHTDKTGSPLEEIEMKAVSDNAIGDKEAESDDFISQKTKKRTRKRKVNSDAVKIKYL